MSGPCASPLSALAGALALSCKDTSHLPRQQRPRNVVEMPRCVFACARDLRLAYRIQRRPRRGAAGVRVEVRHIAQDDLAVGACPGVAIAVGKDMGKGRGIKLTSPAPIFNKRG